MFEIVTEEEIWKESSSNNKSEEDKLEEYDEFLKSEKGKAVFKDDKSSNELEHFINKENVDDDVFSDFKKRISSEPEQVSTAII